MARSTFKVLFYLKRQAEQNGKAPIMSNPAFASFPNQPRICRRIIRRQRKYPASDIVR